MGAQGKGMQIGGGIGVALCAAFLLRWWMLPPEPAWRRSADGTAWEATRDINGALILPERRYSLEGSGTAPVEVSWTMRATDGESSERSVTAGSVSAGAWSLVMQAGSDAPRRAAVIVRVTPASAVDPQTLTLRLAR